MTAAITKIISGAQTGADQGGLEAALQLGIATGGMIPKGFKTENGPMPELADKYGLEESASAEYPPRTRYNVVSSDATIIFGSLGERGTKLTRKMCLESKVPCLHVDSFEDTDIQIAKEFLKSNKVRVLNIAGNRESKYPGLQAKVREFLVKVLS